MISCWLFIRIQSVSGQVRVYFINFANSIFSETKRHMQTFYPILSTSSFAYNQPVVFKSYRQFTRHPVYNVDRERIKIIHRNDKNARQTVENVDFRRTV